MRSSLGDRARLIHIMESIKVIEEYSGNIDFNGFLADKKTRDAVEKQLAVIGEACDHLTEELKVRYPSMEWFKIKGLRNRIIHQYFNVDIRIVWDVIESDLPSLKEQVSLMLMDFTDDSESQGT